jgi:16S rRNA (cytidine1402-2'-O)-methyltransferase
LYESPYRIEKLLGELASVAPGRQVAVGRELTKRFEEFWRGSAAEVADSVPKRVLKGEFVVLIAPETEARTEVERTED